MVLLWVSLILATAFVAGMACQRWLRWRGLAPEQRDQERLAEMLLRQARRLRGGVVLHDPVSGRWFGAERRFAVVGIGVVENHDMGADHAITSWYIVTRWGSPPGVARVLRHQKPTDEPFGLDPADAHDLLDLEERTGAVGADIDELAQLVEQLDRATPRLWRPS